MTQLIKFSTNRAYYSSFALDCVLSKIELIRLECSMRFHLLSGSRGLVSRRLRRVRKDTNHAISEMTLNEQVSFYGQADSRM